MHCANMKRINKRTPSNCKPSVLFVAQDVGGFNACWPIFIELRKEKWNVKGVFGSLNRKKASGSHIDFFELGDELIQKFVGMFDTERPDVIIVGTSTGLSADKLVVQMARVYSIPTVAIVDYWGNAHVRFSTPGTKDRAYTPNWILVPDEICRKQIKKDGFDIRRVIVTGNPHFDQFSRNARSSISKGIKSSRRVSFFSQPFSEVVKENPEMDLGLDERKIFCDILHMLHEVDRSIQVSVVFHPREKIRTKYDACIGKSGMRVRLENKKTAAQMTKTSKFVIGMNTMALVESALFGVPSISYQPCLKKEDPLITNRFGLTSAAYDRKVCTELIRRFIRQKRDLVLPRHALKLADGQATKRVLAFLRLHWL